MNTQQAIDHLEELFNHRYHVLELNEIQALFVALVILKSLPADFERLANLIISHSSELSR